MDYLKITASCNDEQWLVFNDLYIRGIIRMDETWDGSTITATTSKTMRKEVERYLTLNYIMFTTKINK